jgi:hypothetical protein
MMKRPSLLLFILLVFASPSLAQDGMPVKFDLIKRSIVFLYGALPSGEVNPTQPLATGFLVGVPLKSNPSKASILLVTARHVVDPGWATCSQRINPTKIFMRLNKKEFDPSSSQSGVDYLPIEAPRDGSGDFG